MLFVLINLIHYGYYRNPKEVANILDNNILGPLRICQAFAPLLKGNASAKNDSVSKIILLGSERGSLAAVNDGSGAAYSMSKVRR